MNKSFLIHAVGYAAICSLAVAGTAQALPGENTVDSGDIIDGQVRRADISGSAVNSARVADESLTGADVLNETLTYADVQPDSLFGKQIVESSLNFNVGCRPGLTRSWARIKGSATMPSEFTMSSTFVDLERTCVRSTDIIQARRLGVGNYEVQFTPDNAGLAIATQHGGDGDTDNTIAVTSMGSGLFRVVMRDQSGPLDDGWFQIMTVG